MQPWDGLKGYAMVYGVTRMRGTTFANFNGPTNCGGTYRTYAIGNHVKEPDAFHPVFMRDTNLQSVNRCEIAAHTHTHTNTHTHT